MRIVVLIDNTADGDGKLINEHGLSLYIESGGKRILLDTGLSGSFVDNAYSAGVDLGNLDFCFLSHGHNDHTGGLRRFVETFPFTKIYLSETILHEHYFTSRHGIKRNLSTDNDLLERYADRFVPVKGNQWISDNIAAVYCHHHDFPCPQGNIFLTKEKDGVEIPDDFNHEMALAVKTGEGMVVFSSCSHNGAVNIMKSCEDFTDVHSLNYFIGGLHFVDGEKTEEEVSTFCHDIRSEYANTGIITGHCTSDKAKTFLKASDLRLDFFHTGSEIILLEKE